MNKKIIKMSLTTVLIASLFAGCKTLSEEANEEQLESTVNIEEIQNNINSQESIDENSKYVGDKSISGSVENIIVAENENKQILSSRAFNEETQNINEIIKLYVLDETGKMKDTGLFTYVNTDGTYSLENVASNQEYILRYIKDLGEGKVVEMKSNVEVKEENITSIKVDRVSTLVVDTINKAVEESILGLEVDEEKVKEIIKTVKKTVKDTITTLVTSGVIEIPSKNDLIVELDQENGESISSFKSKVKENEKIVNAASMVLTNEKLSTKINLEKKSQVLLKYSKMSNKELIKEIFKQTENDDSDVPDWTVEFLGDNYDKLPENYTMQTFFEKLTFEKEDNNHDIDMFISYLGIEDTTLLDNILNIANQEVVNNGFDKLKEEMLFHYQLKDKTNRTNLEDKKISEFPAVIEYLFPKNVIENMTKESKLENIGQAIVLVMFSENILLKEIIGEELQKRVGKNEDFGKKLENISIASINPMFIFEDLGFNKPNNLLKYDKLEIENFKVRTDTYLSQSGENKEFLSIYSALIKPSWIIGINMPNAEDEITAKLIYPTGLNTTSEQELEVIIPENDRDYIMVNYSPWKENCSTVCKPDETKMNINNHISGDYIVEITYNGKKITKTIKDVFVLKNAKKYKPELLTPTEKNYDFNNNDSSKFDYYEMLNDVEKFKTNVDLNGDGENDAIKDLKITWSVDAINKKIEELELPKNIIPAYQVVINYMDGENNEDIEIYNTWWNNKPIIGNKFILPMELKETENGSKYYVNVELVFLNKETGAIIGHGGYSSSEFEVGLGTELTGEEVINISGSVNVSDLNYLDNPNLKVGLVSDICIMNSTSLEYTCSTKVLKSVELKQDNSYSISFNSSIIEDYMETITTYPNLNIVLFDDANDDGEILRNMINNRYENVWWNSDKGLWFDFFGGMNIHVDTFKNDIEFDNSIIEKEYSHEKYKLKRNEDINIEGFDFKTIY